MIRNGPKRTISANGGFRLLQMVLEPDNERRASKDAGILRGVDYEIPYRSERETKHSL